MMQEIGRQAIVNIASHVIFIVITWQVLQGVRLDSIFKKSRIFEARVFVIFLTIVIGSTVSHFFLDLIDWSQQILYLF